LSYSHITTYLTVPRHRQQNVPETWVTHFGFWEPRYKTCHGGNVLLWTNACDS
jgi:hypothetical protein